MSRYLLVVLEDDLSLFRLAHGGVEKVIFLGCGARRLESLALCGVQPAFREEG